MIVVRLVVACGMDFLMQPVIPLKESWLMHPSASLAPMST
jgi:hypothetical protein